MRILVTGGAGFIGSTLVRDLLARGHEVQVLDKLTYAGDLASLDEVKGQPGYSFIRADIVDAVAVKAVFETFQPQSVAHLAAETHVDRSLTGPAEFVRTNVMGTQVMLDTATAHYQGLAPQDQGPFRFLHISTDEVFGSLGAEGFFDEDSPYSPRSPYAASKAASDHLVRAWANSYGLPCLISNCSNNYGPRQFPEKLIPRLIQAALQDEVLPIYGDGSNVRDWLHVEDHSRALCQMLEQAEPGATYCIGGGTELSNLDLAHRLCAHLDHLAPRPDGRPHAEAIQLVADRPGHDWRYAIKAGRIERDLGWTPQVEFEAGLRRTVEWYLRHQTSA